GLGRLTRRLAGALAPGMVQRQPKALGVLEHAHSWAGAYLLRRGLFLPHELHEVIDPEIAGEGLRRLQPLRRLARSLTPDPGSDVGRVCALESAHYMRNQLLRDADWAGMAHGIEVRAPLVDATLLATLACAVPGLASRLGKTALAAAPRLALPAAIAARPKTGFSTPVGAWASVMDVRQSRSLETQGLSSRRWSQAVLAAFS
ncbi:MAG: asparagine synthase-related protein, partial [Stellaceae bacterium]